MRAKEEPLGTTSEQGTLTVVWRDKGFMPIQFTAFVRHKGYALGYFTHTPWESSADVTLYPAHTFSSTVRNRDGLPVSGARVKIASRSASEGSRHSQRVSFGQGMPFDEARPESDFICDANGRFTIPDTHIGEWISLTISHPDYATSRGGCRIQDNVSDVVDYEGRRVLVLEKGGSIKGRLRGYVGDGSDIGVGLRPIKQGYIDLPVIAVSADGSFTNEHVPYGDYWAIVTYAPQVWKAMRTEWKKNPRLATSRFHPSSWVALPVAVTVAEGTNSVPDIAIQKGTLIRAHVVNAATQQPISDARIRAVLAGLSDTLSRQFGSSAVSQTNGIAELRVLPGEVTLQVESYQGEQGKLKTPRTERLKIPQTAEPYDVRLPLDLTPNAKNP